jgi:hypothetical protein
MTFNLFMRKFEFILLKTIKEKSWVLLAIFLISFITSEIARGILALIFISQLLPKDIENGRISALLSLPMKNWEILLFDYLTAAIVYSIPVIITRGVFGLLPGIVLFTYLYSLCLAFSSLGRGNIIFPMLIVLFDAVIYALSYGWRVVSPLAQNTYIASIVAGAISLICIYTYLKKFGLR